MIPLIASAPLLDRGVVRVSGEDAYKLLNGIITCDLDRVSARAARFGALLNPQGKILFDFMVIGDAEGGYYFDCARIIAADFAKRLNFYKLRAKVLIENLSETHGILARWGSASAPVDTGIVYADPRLAALGQRAILPLAALDTGAGSADYEGHRVAYSIPDTQGDFGAGEVFPHEMLMDQLHGVDFDKGCYIGQEVVSRMQHRGTARNRVLLADFADAEPPAKGSQILAGDKVLGQLGRGALAKAIALVRLDRASEALAAGVTIHADGIPLKLSKPDFAAFDFPIVDFGAKTAS